MKRSITGSHAIGCEYTADGYEDMPMVMEVQPMVVRTLSWSDPRL